jgi:hypothetical protein
MAATAVLATVASDGASEEGLVERQIATASKKLGNIETKILTSETLRAAERNVGAESGVLQSAPGKIVFRFHSRDLHMVLGPAKDGKPIRFKMTLEGAAPGENSGVDSAPDGTGEIREPRLYQLIRQKSEIELSRSNSSIPAYRLFRSRLGRDVGIRVETPGDVERAIQRALERRPWHRDVKQPL